MMKPKKYVAPGLTTGAKKFVKKRMYDSVDWTTYRVKFIAKNPTCYACGGSSRIVDHFRAHKESSDLFWKEDNYIPLCKPCHDEITGRFDKAAAPDLQAKLNWLMQKRIETGTTVKVNIVPFN